MLLLPGVSSGEPVAPFPALYMYEEPLWGFFSMSHPVENWAVTRAPFHLGNEEGSDTKDVLP